MRWSVFTQVDGDRACGRPRRLQQIPVEKHQSVRFQVRILEVDPPTPFSTAPSAADVEEGITLQSKRSMVLMRKLSILLVFAVVLSSVTTSAEVRPERWRWSNPLPHGNNVLDMLDH